MNQTFNPSIPGPSPEEPYRSFIHQFLKMLYQEGHSKRTIVSYGWHLNKLAIWLEQQGVRSPDQFSAEMILNWGVYLRTKYSAQTRKQSIVSTRMFFRFLEKMGYCSSTVVENLEKILVVPVTKITPQRTLTEDEISELIAVCGGNEPREVRDRAIIVLLVDTGLRAMELCGIQISNVSLRHRKISIIGKGGEKEEVFFSNQTAIYLKEWLEVRARLKTNSDHLFVGIGGITPGQTLTPRGLRIILKKLGNKAGIEQVHPHAFRRSFATLRIKQGQSTRSVQRLGRWKNLGTFERYTQALLKDDEFARNEAEHFTPLKKILGK